MLSVSVGVFVKATLHSFDAIFSKVELPLVFVIFPRVVSSLHKMKMVSCVVLPS